ncbi:MAG: hypothetical protein V5A37_08940 [Halobacteriales archaeon]
MGSEAPTPDGTDAAADCSTTSSFADHGIDSGVRLITRTHRRLADAGGPSFEPTPDFFDRLEAAFVRAYLGTVEEAGVPDHVAAAIDDARAMTAVEFADRPDADLRTDVVPAFYQHAAGYHCAYLESPAAGRWPGPAD